MLMRVGIASLFLLGALGGWSAGARAETAEERQACIDDVHTHCGEFIPDRDAIVLCLKRKVKVLSPACRRVMTRPYNPKDN
jgi:hypothetical protein